MFEQADNETNPILKKSLLTFVIVGGGFAGIETVGELMDLLYDARKHYPNIEKTDIMESNLSFKNPTTRQKSKDLS